MTGVPAPKPNAYRPWGEIATELASMKDLAKALELAHELNYALAQQSSEEKKAARSSMTEDQLSLVVL